MHKLEGIFHIVFSKSNFSTTGCWRQKYILEGTMKKKSKELLVQYGNDKKLYDNFCHSVRALLYNLLDAHHIRFTVLVVE